MRAYDVDLSEATGGDKGGHAYASFDAFFTRSLLPGARTYDATDQGLVSPADGRLDDAGAVTREGLIEVKGRPYRAADLLGDEDEARQYLGGQFAVVYLSPRDYHRVHAPAAGMVSEIRSYPGDLFPVNQISQRHIPGFLARNRRVAVALDTMGFGRVTVVLVAAMIVGRITATGIEGRDVPLGTHRFDPPLVMERGAELGVFHLGSTAVLFAEPDAVPSFNRALGPIRLGQALTRPADSPHRNADGRLNTSTLDREQEP